jgi:hypothetical protein
VGAFLGLYARRGKIKEIAGSFGRVISEVYFRYTAESEVCANLSSGMLRYTQSALMISNIQNFTKKESKRDKGW